MNGISAHAGLLPPALLASALLAPGLLIAALLAPAAAVPPACGDYRSYLHWVSRVDAPEYATAARGGLVICDVGDPRAPRIAATLDGRRRSVERGGVGEPRLLRRRDAAEASAGTGVPTRVFVCVADEKAGLQVIDATTPSAPRVIGGAATGGASGVAVSAAAGIVAVASGKRGLQLFPVQCAW